MGSRGAKNFDFAKEAAGGTRLLRDEKLERIQGSTRVIWSVRAQKSRAP